MSFTNTWDAIFESLPDNSTYGYLIDNYFRQLYVAIRERMEIDHIWKVGEADGCHNKVSLAYQAAKPTAAAGYGYVYSKDVGSGAIELFYEDAAGNELQLTTAGKLDIGAFLPCIYAADAVGTDSYAVTLSPVPSALTVGMLVTFKAGIFNTGACTLAVNGLTATAIKKCGSLAKDLAIGDIHTGQVVMVVYDGTNFQIIGDPGDPVGTVKAWTTDTAPSGYLECDGASLLRTDYPELYAALGTVYGTADVTHFNVPDLRGDFLRGWDHAAAIDPNAATRTASAATGATMTAGDHVGTEQADAFKSHTHSGGIYPGGASNVHGGADLPLPNGVIGDTGGDETRPKNTNVMYIIRY